MPRDAPVIRAIGRSADIVRRSQELVAALEPAHALLQKLDAILQMPQLLLIG
jgi:hypothetical protein